MASARGLRLTPQGRMIDSQKHKKMHDFNEFGVTSPSTRRGGTRPEFSAGFPLDTRVGASTGSAAR